MKKGSDQGGQMRFALIMLILSGCVISSRSFPHYLTIDQGITKTPVPEAVEALNKALGCKAFILKESNKDLVARFDGENIVYLDQVNRLAGRALIYYTGEFDIMIGDPYSDDVIWHELGHAMGLEHTETKGDVMYPEQLSREDYNKGIRMESVEAFAGKINDEGLNPCMNRGAE